MPNTTLELVDRPRPVLSFEDPAIAYPSSLSPASPLALFLQPILPLNFSTGCSCGSGCCACLRPYSIFSPWLYRGRTTPSLTWEWGCNHVSTRPLAFSYSTVASGLSGWTGAMLGGAGIPVHLVQVQKAQGLLRVCETSTWPRKQTGVSKWPPLVQLPSQVQMKQVLGI